MNPGFKLYRLQQVDSQLDKSTKRLEEINAILADDSEIVTATQRKDSLFIDLEKARKELREAEYNTQAQRSKIKDTETRLYSGSVTNPKELQDLTAESAALKRYLSVLEDRQLEKMIASDEAESAFQGAEKDLESIIARKTEANATLTGERTNLLKDLEKLEEERKAALSGISDEELRTYEGLRKSRQGVAVAAVVDKACSACGSTLNASLLQQARSPSQITRCSFCNRILYAG